ncbi:class I SAM-dependent methyltransferase [Pseudonocardia nematodicida]|uniref:Class I SAM-dependent methyltransferase n=1 Tax=Pseudonocardia nematodicida TaxID=1206997 RepID=A0ABV1KLD0_9PSEU
MDDTGGQLERLDRLAGPEGTALLGRLAGADRSGDAALRLGTALRREHDADLVADAMAQAGLRDRAAAKFSRASSMWFTREGLEQASSEVVARHRAARYAGLGRLADLCCGIGGDLLALAGGHEVTGVDRDPVHRWMAERNAAVYDGRGRTVGGDVRDADLSGVDGVFVDPARRTSGGRMRTGDSEPPLDWCLGLTGRVPAVGIKAAPGIDRDLVPPGWEIEFLALGREIKESAIWSPALATARARATVLDPDGTAHTLAGEPDPADGDTGIPVTESGAWLLDPNPTVTRAGLVSALAVRSGTTRIDPRIAFLTAGDRPEPSPFARTLRVIDSRPWDQKRLPRLLRELDVGAVDVRRRGLAGDVDAIARKLRGRGSRRATVVMTRADDRPWGLVCVDP